MWHSKSMSPPSNSIWSSEYRSKSASSFLKLFSLCWVKKKKKKKKVFSLNTHTHTRACTHRYKILHMHTWRASVTAVLLPGQQRNWVLGMQPGTSSSCAGSAHYGGLIGICSAFCFGFVNKACTPCQYLARSAQLWDEEPFCSCVWLHCGATGCHAAALVNVTGP